MAHTGIRKVIKDFIKANPECTEADIMEEGDSTGSSIDRVPKILERWIANGRVVKSGNYHSWAA